MTVASLDGPVHPLDPAPAPAGAGFVHWTKGGSVGEPVFDAVCLSDHVDLDDRLRSLVTDLSHTASFHFDERTASANT